MSALADYADALDALASQLQAMAASMRANGWEPQDLDEGLTIDRMDANGQELRVGDRVQVHGSDRYGSPVATVKGPGPDTGDGKQRVHVALENGQNDVYTPSAGRVYLVAQPAD